MSKNTPIIAGGAGKFSSIDPMNPKDVALVRDQIKEHPRRWRGLTDSIKDSFVAGLVEAADAMRAGLKKSETIEDSARAATVLASIGRTAAVMEGQVQDDFWRVDQNARLDSGKLTERVGIAPVVLHEPMPLDSPPAGG